MPTAQKRTCRACRKPAVKTWDEKPACATCYERARRGGDFFNTTRKRRFKFDVRRHEVKKLWQRGWTEREIAAKLELPKSTVHDDLQHG